MTSRAQIEQRVDELAAERSGQEFADAVAAYAHGLNDGEREVLESILLQRARALEDAVSERFEAKGWIRRTLDRIADVEAATRRRR
jgi:hypothetical protein